MKGSHGIYLHPFDLREASHGPCLQRIADLGFREAAMAVAYHAGRWLVPSTADTVVRYLEDGTVHFPPHGPYGDIKAVASSEVRPGRPSPLQEFIDHSRDKGLAPIAWTVLFHNSRLGALHPTAVVRNAFGDRYSYALCPARPETQAYCAAVCVDLANHAGLAGIELEAVGFLGYRHGSHHDKASFQISRELDFLLSYCFCSVCCAMLSQQGVDPEGLRERVRVGIRRRVHDGCTMAQRAAEDAEAEIRAELQDAGFDALLRHRDAVQRQVLRMIRATVPAGLPLTAHVQPDPWFTGSQLGRRLPDCQGLLDGAVLTHYGEDPSKIASLWQHLEDGGLPLRLAIWPKAPQFTSDADLLKVRDIAASRGAGVRIYHLGLLPTRTIERVGRVLHQ